MAGFTARANASLNLASKSAVVVGGTQGIGSGIALRLAQAGASVRLVGRNRPLADQLILKLEDASPKEKVNSDMPPAAKPTFDFLQADLSTVDGMKTALADLQSRGSVDYLFQCQGRPPTGTWAETPDGIEARFATMILSKFAIMNGLAESGTLKEAAVCIGATGSGRTDFDPKDPGLKNFQRENKYGMLSSAARDGVVLDALCKELNTKYSHLRFMHLFPGFVATNAAQNNKFPFPIPQLASLFGPLIGKFIANTPESYSNIPVFCASNPQATETLTSEFVNFLCQSRDASTWAQDETHREQVFEAMQSLLAK